jgi:phospholipid/cholesterol/gamma-HCH transport system permease protein
MNGFIYALGFFIRIIRGGIRVFHAGAARKILVMQIFFTFVQALGLASLLALGIGAAVNVIGFPFLAQLSQERYIYSLLIIIITRELGPLLGAFIIISRSATAIATEMAGMVISHEVEAYIAVGVDPIEHLAVPRFFGVTISMFLLNVYFSLFGLAGSFLVAQLFNAMPPSIYFANLLDAFTMADLIISILKSIAFGMIISVTAILKGFSVDRASTEIPVAGLRAVSSAFGGCVLADILLSALYYMMV